MQYQGARACDKRRYRMPRTICQCGKDMQVQQGQVTCTATTTTSAFLTHWGRDKMPAILQTTFSNAFSWIKIYKLKFALKAPIDNIPALVQIMGWYRPGHEPLSDPMMVSLPMHTLGLNELMERLYSKSLSRLSVNLLWITQTGAFQAYMC